MDQGNEGTIVKQNVWTVCERNARNRNEKETWSWQIKADLKVETEAILRTAQEQTIQMNYEKHKIDKTAQSPLCRMCDKKSETTSHDNAARILHRKLYEKYNLK